MTRTRAFALHLALLGVLVHAMSFTAASAMSVAAAGQGGFAPFWVLCLAGQSDAAAPGEAEGSPDKTGLHCPVCAAASYGVLPAPVPAAGRVIPAVPEVATGPIRLHPGRVGFAQPPSRAPPGPV